MEKQFEYINRVSGSDIPESEPIPTAERGEYLDAGLVVEGLNMAAGASVNGNWIDDVQWVRHFVVFAQADQVFNIEAHSRDSAGVIAEYNSTLETNVAAQPTPGWRLYRYVSKPVGKGMRFAIKNTAVNPNTYGRLKAQLFSS